MDFAAETQLTLFFSVIYTENCANWLVVCVNNGTYKNGVALSYCVCSILFVFSIVHN